MLVSQFESSLMTRFIDSVPRSSYFRISIRYTMDWQTRDYNPAQYYTRLPLGCRYSNGLGMLVVLTVMFGSYAVMDMKATMVRRNARRSSFLDMEEMA